MLGLPLPHVVEHHGPLLLKQLLHQGRRGKIRWLIRVPDATLDRIRVAHETCVAVDDADVDDLCIEDLLDLVADELVHRLHVEVLGKPLLHAVDDGQLRRALVRLCQEALGLVEQTSVFEGHAHARRQGAQQTLVGIRECMRNGALEAQDAQGVVAGHDGYAEPALGRLAQDDGPEGPPLLRFVQPQGFAGAQDTRREAIPDLDRLDRRHDSILDRVWEADGARHLIGDADEDGVGAKDAAYALADELDDRVELELLRQCRTDLVHHCQFGVALLGLRQQALGLVEQPSVLERHAHAGCQRRQKPLVPIGERVRLGPIDVDDAEHLAAGDDRGAQPRLLDGRLVVG